MPFMTLGGVTVPVLVSAAERENIEIGGPMRRNFNGEPINETRGEKFVDSYTTRPMLPADVAALKAAIANNAVVTGNGDFVGNVATNVRARITRETFRRMPDGVRKQLDIVVWED